MKAGATLGCLNTMAEENGFGVMVSPLRQSRSKVNKICTSSQVATLVPLLLSCPRIPLGHLGARYGSHIVRRCSHE